MTDEDDGFGSLREVRARGGTGVGSSAARVTVPFKLKF